MLRVGSNEKRKLLVLSHVLPFPHASGQCQRVRYTLEAVRERFHVTFATAVPAGQIEETKTRLLEWCDEAVVWPSRSSGNIFRRGFSKVAAMIYAAATGLKESNYTIGRREFAAGQLTRRGLDNGFDLVLLEYWHAAASLSVFRAKGIPCVIDLHNVLWQAREKELSDRKVPMLTTRWLVERYRRREERAWSSVEGLITINAAEHEYIHSAAAGVPLFYAPMGIRLDAWQYCWNAALPPRLIYYGGLASPHNRRDALRCYHEVMPRVWDERPDTAFWIVGSNPPEEIRALARDPRVTVTGFLERPQEVLSRATAALCPWSGTYGFRSRLVEVMVLGVPVVASADAAYGMGFEPGEGFFACSSNAEMAHRALELINTPAYAAAHSKLARRQIEELYSFENSYGRLAAELDGWISRRTCEAVLESSKSL